MQFILRNYLRDQKVAAAFSNEVDIPICQGKLLRADGFAKSLDCLLLEDKQYISEAAGSNADELTLKSLPGLAIPLKDLWGD